jgi:hypothetical protein
MKQEPKKVKEIFEDIECPHSFTMDEIVELGRTLARATQAQESLESRKKETMADFTAQIQRAESERMLAATKIGNGYEMRKMRCRVEMKPAMGRKSYFRCDTNEYVRDGEMMSYDYQQNLPLEPESPKPTTPESASPEPKPMPDPKQLNGEVIEAEPIIEWPPGMIIDPEPALWRDGICQNPHEVRIDFGKKLNATNRCVIKLREYLEKNVFCYGISATCFDEIWEIEVTCKGYLDGPKGNLSSPKGALRTAFKAALAWFESVIDDQVAEGKRASKAGWKKISKAIIAKMTELGLTEEENPKASESESSEDVPF